MNENHGTCDVCQKPAWGGSKREPATKCFEHFGCVCPECGHEGFWLSAKSPRNPGRWFCFSLNCNWASEDHPHPDEKREPHPAHMNYPGGCPKSLLEKYASVHWEAKDQ